MKTIRKLWSAIKQKVRGFYVSVHWEGKHFVHHARSQSEALEWAKQYPNDAFVVVYSLGDDSPVSCRVAY